MKIKHIIRLLLTIIVIIGLIGLVVWLIYLFLSICGWIGGLVVLFVVPVIYLCVSHHSSDARYKPMFDDNLEACSSDCCETKQKPRPPKPISVDNLEACASDCRAPKQAPRPKPMVTYGTERKSQRKGLDEPHSQNTATYYSKPKFGFWSRLFTKRNTVYSSIFAPGEVKRNSHMLVQVYLHLFEETEKVKAFAQESDKDAERRDYIPLQCKLKNGDKVDVLLQVYGKELLMADKKFVIWQGTFTKCSFDYFVPKDIDVDELSCVALLSVNGVPVGEMRFITKIVESPRQLNPEILAHKYKKVFISYSHKDEAMVKFLHKGLEIGGVPHFFDRSYLKPGDFFPQKIQDYIDTADLFILCWSENASKSEYVEKERLQALGRAFPQVKPEQDAKLRIYAISIEPRAEMPSDMKNYYHFGEI